MAARIKSLSKSFVWVILVLVVAGLGGYGALNLSGTARTVATVGDETVSTSQYARELQREIRGIEAQTGKPLPMDQARQMGLDQRVLSRLVALAALDNETARIGLSIGDGNLQKEIVAIPAFKGPDGKFDRDTYKYQLEQVGLSEAEFEADIRAEAARTLVQGAIIAGAKMPAVMTDTIAAYIAARRSFTMATLTADALDTPVPAPTDTDLKAYYDAHPDDFTLPETKKLTYVLLTPDMVIDQVEVDETALHKLYEERSDEYNVPERRLVERLVFPDETSAKDAKAQLEVGGTTFEALVADRGLKLSDIDMGDVSAADLGDAADAVFAADQGAVVGPLPTDLGPALFRINGTLAARVTSFEDAQADLRKELATESARHLIETRAESINNALAGGATLEDLATEDGMKLDHMDWSAQSSDGAAAYDAFRKAAAKATKDDYPEAAFLADGGLFALRVDDVLPPRPDPLDHARDKVAAAWTLAETEKALRTKADSVIADLAGGTAFSDTGLPVDTETGLTRTAFIDGTPADFMTEVFAMKPEETRAIGSGDKLFIVRLDDVLPPEENDQLKKLKSTYAQQVDQALGQALFETYVRDAQIRATPTVNQQALNAAQSNFR